MHDLEHGLTMSAVKRIYLVRGRATKHATYAVPLGAVAGVDGVCQLLTTNRDWAAYTEA